MKTIKKLTAIMLSFAVLASMSLSAMAVPSYTFDTAEADGLVPVKEILFAESFDGSDTTSSRLGSQSANPLTVLSRVSSSTDGTKNFLWVNNVSTANQQATPYYSLKSDNAFKGEYTIEFKFNKTQNHTINAGKQSEAKTDVMFFGAGYTDGTNKNLAIKLGIDENDKPYYVDKTGAKKYFLNDTDHAWNAGFDLESYWTWNEGGWLGKTGNTVTADFARSTADWYSLKVKVNTENSTYRVYLNGALVAKDIEFIPVDGIDWKETGINLPYALGYDCNVGVRYVYDDMRIYREVVGFDSIYANDFNFYPDGTTWVGHTAAANLTGVAELGLSVFGGKGSTLQTSAGKLVTTQSGSGAVIDSFIAEDNIVIEGEVNVPQFTSSEEKTYAPIITLAGASNGGGIRIGVNQNGEIYSSWFHELSSLTKLGTMTLGTPHQFLLYADFKSLTADFYIDGKLVYSGIGLGRATNTASGIANGQGIAIGFGYHKEAPQVAVSYDNIKVYRDERQSVLRKVKADLDTKFVRTQYVIKKVALPTTIDGYNITWSEVDGSNIAISDDGKTALVTQTNSLQENVPISATVTDAAGEYSITRTLNVLIPAGPQVGINNDTENMQITATARQVHDGAILVFAMYDWSGKIKDIRMTVVQDPVRTATFDYSEYGAGKYIVKAFLLEEMNTLVPYRGVTGPVTITVAEKTAE